MSRLNEFKGDTPLIGELVNEVDLGNDLDSTKYLKLPVHGADLIVNREDYPELADAVYSIQEYTLNYEQAINNPTPVASDNFGTSIFMSGDSTRLIVGAPYEDTGASAAGSAYIFSRSGTTWTLEQEINNPSAVINDGFGNTVSIDYYGDRVLIAADGDDTGASNAGSVYVYSRSDTTWSLEQTINNPTPVTNDGFGYDSEICSDGSRLIVGAWGEDTGASAAGAVYVYSRSETTWSLEQEINNPSALSSEYFGNSVSIDTDGSRIAIGTPSESSTTSNIGAVYIYSRSETTWSQESEILNPSPTNTDNFGYECSISDDGSRVIIGAYQEDTGAASAGSVYVYSRSGTTWSLEQEINNPNPSTSDYFGWSVSINSDGSRVIIGAYQEDGASNSNDGSIYIYSRVNTTWSLDEEITSPDPNDGGNYGYSVGINSDGTRVCGGAWGEDAGVGNAYVHHFDPKFIDKQIVFAGLEQEINNPSPVAGDTFGYSVSIDSIGNRLIVGTSNAATPGKAFVFIKINNSWILEQEISNPSPVSGEYFGADVAIDSSGSRVIIGAWEEETGAAGAGSVYVYSRSDTTWSLEQTINNPTPVAYERFGISVDIDEYGDRLIVGAYLEDTGAASAGSAYVYSRSGTTWSLEQTINNPSAVADDNFGIDVSIDSTGTRVIIGAYREDTGADAAGSVYVYSRSDTTWSLEQEINNPTPVASDNFGNAVDIDSTGTRVVIGAYSDNVGASNTGAIHIYSRSGTTWSLEQTINNPVPGANDFFGIGVSINSTGDIILIGSYQDDTGANQAGSAYMYIRTDIVWSLEQIINNPTPIADDNFGRSVSMNSKGTKLIVGASRTETGIENAGSVYSYSMDFFNPVDASQIRLVGSDGYSHIRIK